MLIMLLFFVASCGAEYLETDPDRIDMMHSSPTFKGQFYVGSDDINHFFIERWQNEEDRKFKVNKEFLKVYNEIPLNSDEIPLWPFNPDKGNVEEFGETSTRKLYRIKS